MTGVTFDAGALIALDRDQREAWTALKRYVGLGAVPVVPTVAVAQTWRSGSRQARLARALKSCRIEPLSDDLARGAGELCGRAGTADVVDAAIVVSASRRQDTVITSDASDLRHLAEHLAIGRVTIVELS